MCPIVPTFTCGFVRSNFSFAIFLPQNLSFRTASAVRNLLFCRPYGTLSFTSPTQGLRLGLIMFRPCGAEFVWRGQSCPRIFSVVLINLLELRPKFRAHFFNLEQVKLFYLRPVGDRKTGIESLRLLPFCQCAFDLLKQAFRHDRIQIANPNTSARNPLQKFLNVLRREGGHNRALQLSEFLFLLDLDRCLFECHREHLFKFWSGRRESNPRPTAWKAVTLPLSYSRIPTCCFPL